MLTQLPTPQESPRNLRRERRLWHDRTRPTPSIGCAACPDHGICGGLQIGDALFDCLGFCCHNAQDCDTVCRNKPKEFAQRVREVGGFSFDNVPRAPMVSAPSLPPIVPLLYHGSGRSIPFKPPAVGDRRIGFVRAIRSRQDDEDPLLTGFLMDAQRAAREVAGLRGTTPGQLVAAMQELENNIHEHSDAPDTGLLAFRATRGAFEFVAADRGIGILRSLQRCSTFAALQDHGNAIQAALSDGTSRFGSDSRRGHGFRPIFLGLANLQGSLRAIAWFRQR